MRYLLDTNVIIFMIGDPDLLSKDVRAIVSEYDSLLYASAESAKELIVAYRKKKLLSNRWNNPEAMLHSIEDEYFIEFLPVRREHMLTYARLEINEKAEHNDPSDHLIIAHAITEKLPLISCDTRFDFYCKQGLDLIFNKR